MGKRIRITAQLTDATTGQDHWSEKFDRDEEGLFAVQDEIVRVISATLVGRMQKDVIAGLMRRPPNSLAAYEYVQRAAALPLGDAVAEAEARRLLECAIALDPGYALANEGLAISYRAEWALDLSGSDHLIDQALAYAKKAVALDANNDSCQTTLGLILMDHHEYDLGEHHLRKGLSLNPNRPEALAIFAQIYTYCGRPDEALEHFAIAQSIDPFFEPPWFWRTQGVAFFVAGRYEEAIAAMSKSSGMPHWAHGFLAASYAYLDRMEQATYHAAETMRLAPEFSILNAVSKEPFKFDAERQHLVEGMRRAGLPD
jgi:tetratricopeptide (TPR) repeat protein